MAKISEVIEMLQREKRQHGDIECTVLHGLKPVGKAGDANAEVFETTADNVVFIPGNENFRSDRVRITL